MKGNTEGLRTAIDCVAEWCSAYRATLRMAIPVIMFIVLGYWRQNVYIAALNIVVPWFSIYSTAIVTHAIAVWYGLESEKSRGGVYEVAACFLATEAILFIYFMGRHFIAAVVLTMLFLVGLVWMFILGRKKLKCMYGRRYIPKNLMRDIIVSNSERNISYSVLGGIVLRRYMMIAAAALLVVPSFIVISEYVAEATNTTESECAITESARDEQLLANMEILSLLDDSAWEQCDAYQKIVVLQVIADIETKYMGIKPVTVVNYTLENQIGGSYTHKGRRVQIDLEKYKKCTQLEYIKTILHECRHAYQYDCVDSLNWDDEQIQTGIYFRQVREWNYEQSHYVSMDEDRELYFKQEIEKDARHYAAEGTYIYGQYILQKVFQGQ